MESGDHAVKTTIMEATQAVGEDKTFVDTAGEPEVVWLSLSEGLGRLDRPMLMTLREEMAVVRWQYHIDRDESSCFDTALQLVHQYFQSLSRPMHVIGHGMAGALGLVYARWHPQWVKSLTLLSVPPSPANDWQAHYFIRRQHLPCGQGFVISQMVREVFGQQTIGTATALERLMRRDLEDSLSPHSLWGLGEIAAGGAPVPLFVAGSEDDSLLPPEVLERWRQSLKTGDRLWVCPQGRHFFHRFCPDLLMVELMRFWDTLQREPQMDVAGAQRVRVR